MEKATECIFDCFCCCLCCDATVCIDTCALTEAQPARAVCYEHVLELSLSSSSSLSRSPLSLSHSRYVYAA